MARSCELLQLFSLRLMRSRRFRMEPFRARSSVSVESERKIGPVGDHSFTVESRPDVAKYGSLGWGSRAFRTPS